jgi:hypothetical protein
VPSRRALRRGARRAVVGAAGPAAGGLLIAVAAILDQPVQGPWQWTVTALVLVPAVLVHWHSRAETHGFSGAETLAMSAAAGAVAYVLGVVGLVAGAAATLGVVVAAQTGVLAAAAQIAALLSLAVAVRGRTPCPEDCPTPPLPSRR